MPDEQTGVIVKDRELAALNRIIKDMNALDDDARGRVMRYLVARYGNAVLPVKE